MHCSRLQETGDVNVSDFSGVIQQIDEAKEKLGSEFVFVRLSSRSPKDAVLSLPTFRDDYLNAIRKLVREEHALSTTTRVDLNTKLRALYMAGTSAMRVSSGRDAVGLLVRSERIQGDMREALSKHEVPPMRIAVREFVPFDVTFELRAFVYRGRLTAMTQYNSLVYFPELIRHEECVDKHVRAFLNQHLLPLLDRQSSFVVDLIPIPSASVHSCHTCCSSPTDTQSCLCSFDIKVVELNPFAEFAGSGMFAWENPADLKVLLGQDTNSRHVPVPLGAGSTLCDRGRYGPCMGTVCIPGC